MAEQVNPTAEEQEALNSVKDILSGATLSGAAEGDFCDVWRKLSPFIGIIITVVGKIPGYGSILADLLRLVEKQLNSQCSV